MDRQLHNNEKTCGSIESLSVMKVPSWNTAVIIALLVLIGLSFTLNFIGLNWGQPSGYSWQTDSIAGTRIVAHMPNLFGTWKHKYPRVHFLVNAAFYKPFLDHWRENPVTVLDNQGRQALSVLNIERASTLIIISRIISAFMGAGAVVALFLTARLLFNDHVAAFFSGLALACSMHFVFYSHLGNPDTPCAFWFAWSLYWAVKATYIGKRRHFILLGLFCALAICTKDPVVGYVVGLGIAMWLAMTGTARDAGKSFKKALISVFNMKVLTAVLVMAFCFALLNDLLTTPAGFFKRMDFWFGTGVAGYNKSFSGYWPFLQITWRIIYCSLGWPLFIAVIVSTVYCIIRYRWKSAFGILPVVVFYMIIIVPVRLSIPRYFIPGFVGLMLLVGKGSSDWLRWKKLPIVARIVPLLFVYTLSLLYCIGLDMELVDETRYRAERWLRGNVNPDDRVIALTGIAYAPRLQMVGCKYEFAAPRPKNEEFLKRIRPYADYLVLCEKEFKMPKAFDQDFLKALLAGSRGYKEVARFSDRYLYPEKTVFGFAGWPFEHVSMFSPEIIILKREDNSLYR